MRSLIIDTNSDCYLQCIAVASWFTEMQTQFLPKVYVPKNMYIKYLPNVIAINSYEVPIFKVAPYEGPVIIAVPDLD